MNRGSGQGLGVQGLGFREFAVLMTMAHDLSPETLSPQPEGSEEPSSSRVIGKPDESDGEAEDDPDGEPAQLMI